ncbi:predicted protein, partial [Phaeodactylum tricornutum CCAP 1055/1]
MKRYYDKQWDQMFERLLAFRDENGHCMVPKRFPPDMKLGTWVHTQRIQYRKLPVIGRLTDDRIHRLEELGFIWSLRDDWQKHYEELKEYKKSNGHCNVPARYVPNRRLGIWVSAQRQQYKIVQTPPELRPRRSAPLTDDRIELLNELGFTWTIRSRDSLGESWTQRLQDLREFRAIHGHCLVPSRYPPNPELGIWVGTQR